MYSSVLKWNNSQPKQRFILKQILSILRRQLGGGGRHDILMDCCMYATCNTCSIHSYTGSGGGGGGVRTPRTSPPLPPPPPPPPPASTLEIPLFNSHSRCMQIDELPNIHSMCGRIGHAAHFQWIMESLKQLLISAVAAVQTLQRLHNAQVSFLP